MPSPVRVMVMVSFKVRVEVTVTGMDWDMVSVRDIVRHSVELVTNVVYRVVLETLSDAHLQCSNCTHRSSKPRWQLPENGIG